MYERFTDRARKVLQLANQEAQRFNHEYIGTEHILLGLIKEGGGVAAIVLKRLGIDLRTIRREVEKIVCSGPDMVTMGRLPQTPRAKKVIEYAIEEARNVNHNYVGTEHLLLGLIRELEGVASQVLMNLGLTLKDVRSGVLRQLGQEIHEVHEEQRIEIPPPPEFVQPRLESERIRSLEQQLWNVRIVLGALVGALAGTLLFTHLGTVMGLLLGGLVAALGWRTLGVLAGGSAGVLLGGTYLSNDGGGLSGALLGAVVGFLIAEIGGTTGKGGYSGNSRRR